MAGTERALLMRTLVILPNAIGDVICGIGIAKKFLEDGSVTWIVNSSAAGVLKNEGFELIHSPSKSVQNMNRFGARIETMRGVLKDFLFDLSKFGKWDRVVNLHLTRASSLIAGGASAQEYKGPALNDKIISDTWSDFFISSITLGLNPLFDVAERYSMIAGFKEIVRTDFRHKRIKNKKRICLHPGSGWETKRLSVKQAAEIADGLNEFGEVAIIGASHEAEMLDAIKREMKSKPEEFCPGKIDIALQQILSSCLVVTTDTWALHAARAARIPTIALLGPTRVFPSNSGFAISPFEEPSWKDKDDTSINKINSREVVKLAESILDGTELDSADFQNCVWDCRNDFPAPITPLPDSGARTAQRIFAWARGKAFAEIVKSIFPELPQPILMPANLLKQNYRELPSIAKLKENSNSEGRKKFPLFETTFSGKNAERIQKRWIQRTLELISDFEQNNR